MTQISICNGKGTAALWTCCLNALVNLIMATNGSVTHSVVLSFPCFSVPAEPGCFLTGRRAGYHQA